MKTGSVDNNLFVEMQWMKTETHYKVNKPIHAITNKLWHKYNYLIRI